MLQLMGLSVEQHLLISPLRELRIGRVKVSARLCDGRLGRVERVLLLLEGVLVK